MAVKLNFEQKQQWQQDVARFIGECGLSRDSIGELFDSVTSPGQHFLVELDGPPANAASRIMNALDTFGTIGDHSELIRFHEIAASHLRQHGKPVSYGSVAEQGEPGFASAGLRRAPVSSRQQALEDATNYDAMLFVHELHTMPPRTLRIALTLGQLDGVIGEGYGRSYLESFNGYSGQENGERLWQNAVVGNMIDHIQTATQPQLNAMRDFLHTRNLAREAGIA